MNIKWMRRGGQRICHAFRAAEVDRFETAVPLGGCDVFTVAGLAEDPRTKCISCERAIRRIEFEQRQAARKTRLGGPVVRPARQLPAASARTHLPQLKTVA